MNTGRAGNKTNDDMMLTMRDHVDALRGICIARQAGGPAGGVLSSWGRRLREIETSFGQKIQRVDRWSIGSEMKIWVMSRRKASEPYSCAC